LTEILNHALEVDTPFDRIPVSILARSRESRIQERELMVFCGNQIRRRKRQDMQKDIVEYIDDLMITIKIYSFKVARLFSTWKT
jgi:hypothetical protein